MYTNTYTTLVIGSWVDLKAIEISYSFGIVFKWETLFLLTLNIITLLVLLYSLDYMRYSLDINLFFLLMFGFWLSIVCIVTSYNLVVLLIGWEWVGFISYFLINYWNMRTEANKSAIKALTINKMGDVALLYAAIVSQSIFLSTSQLVINNIFKFLPDLSINQCYILIFLIQISSFTKSVQLIFSMWLPDAMEGPTPVSSLMHSSTLVAAGFILILKYYSLFLIDFGFLSDLFLIGVVTSWLGALTLLTTSDIKNNLANSTIVQVSYLMATLGIGAPLKSILQFTAHAIYKVLGFLTLGGIIHQNKDYQDSRVIMISPIQNPILSVCMLISIFSYCGLPNTVAHVGKVDFFTSIVMYSQGTTGFVFLLFLSQVVILISGISLLITCTSNFISNTKVFKKLVFNSSSWEVKHPLALVVQIILALSCLLLNSFLSKFLDIFEPVDWSNDYFVIYELQNVGIDYIGNVGVLVNSIFIIMVTAAFLYLIWLINSTTKLMESFLTHNEGVLYNYHYQKLIHLTYIKILETEAYKKLDKEYQLVLHKQYFKFCSNLLFLLHLIIWVGKVITINCNLYTKVINTSEKLTKQYWWPQANALGINNFYWDLHVNKVLNYVFSNWSLVFSFNFNLIYLHPGFILKKIHTLF